MRTARRYLAREIYRSSFVVLVALLGLFTFFQLVDELDNVSDRFTMAALFYMQALAMPTRLYDLLPIGLLIGAILALAGLAQRNELTILRVSGVSGLRLMVTLWIITLPAVIGATLLSEYATPYAEIKTGEASLQFKGRAGGGRFDSGYWFKEPTPEGSTRILNIAELHANGRVSDVKLYEFDVNRDITFVATAKSGRFEDRTMVLEDTTIHTLRPDADSALKNGTPSKTPLLTLVTEPERRFSSSLTAERLLARVLTPERMSMLTLIDYIAYLKENNLSAERQTVALWRKLVYPFTLIVMMTIAAPIGFMQTRRGGVGAKVFIGILIGVAFFMVNQLALNVGILGGWPAWLTALGPNMIALMLGLAALIGMEYRQELSRLLRRDTRGNTEGV
ncbi:MAG: LPS export ABC transporter permease LptG [Burkholderiaceae bacterium]|nr:LPS export ABC transporter permease LptG [Burkholderiaceae bacterium]